MAAPDVVASRSPELFRSAFRSCLRSGFDLPGQPKIRDANAAVAPDHHVVRLEVAVDQPSGVRGTEAPRRRGEHRQDLRPTAGPFAKPGGQRLPVDELHRDEHAVLVSPAVVNDDHIRVGQARDGLRLAQQPAARPMTSAFAVRVQQLERYFPVQLAVVGRVHLAHSSPADQSQHNVTTHGHPARKGALLYSGLPGCPDRCPADLLPASASDPGGLLLARFLNRDGRRQQIAADRTAPRMRLQPGNGGRVEEPVDKGENRVLIQASHGALGFSTSADTILRWVAPLTLPFAALRGEIDRVAAPGLRVDR